MRDAVLSLLAQSFDEVTARKTVNVLAPFLARRAKVLDAALSGMGRAICAQRATANLRVEAQSLVAGALMSNSAADVDLVISRLKESNKTERESTIQGLSSAVPLDVSTASHESTDVDDVVSYMQSLGGEHIEPTDSDTLQEEINKLQTELVNSRQFFSDTLMTVAQEWAEAKKVALVIDSTVAEAKRK